MTSVETPNRRYVYPDLKVKMTRAEKQKPPLHVLHLPLPSVSGWAQVVEVVTV